MTETSTEKRQMPECPFDSHEIEAAKAVFLANPCWERIYTNAPSGAKTRLEVSFWFSQNYNNWPSDKAGDMLSSYREWRNDIEAAMSDKDLEYMIAVMEKPKAKEHYAALLKDRKAALRTSCGVKLMSYDDFFAMLDEEGEFKSYDYDDETKKSIIGDFNKVLKWSDDPLETHLEDILATAKLMEARVYPSDETMYVRVTVQFLTETAQWSKPYQMLAAWDSHYKLKGYVFPVGKGHNSELPYELEDPPSEAQKQKRRMLKRQRLAALNKTEI